MRSGALSNENALQTGHWRSPYSTIVVAAFGSPEDGAVLRDPLELLGDERGVDDVPAPAGPRATRARLAHDDRGDDDDHRKQPGTGSVLDQPAPPCSDLLLGLASEALGAKLLLLRLTTGHRGPA